MTTHRTGRRAATAAAGTPTLSGANVIDNPQTDFDGCYRKCRIERRHTMEYGGCEHADKPEPTVSMSKVYTDSDGYPSIGYDQYTVPQLGRLIEGAVGDPLRAAAAARVIMHRNDDPAVPPAVPVPPTTHATWLAEAEQRLTAGCPDHGPNGGWLMTCQCEAIDELRRLADEAQQQEPTAGLEVTLVRVRNLHAPDANGHCGHCHRIHPCPTIDALDHDAEAQQQPDTEFGFVPPAAVNLPAGTLEAAEIGANRLDAWARTPQGRNFLAHALVQLARTGWLRTEPGEGFEPVRDRDETPAPEQPAPGPGRVADEGPRS